MTQPVSFSLVAGEASGDLLAGLLLGGLHKQWPDMHSAGIGGPRMAQHGFQAWWPYEKLAVRGYVEVLRHYREIVNIRAQLKQRLLANPPSAFIGVDAPDFNLDLERDLKAAGIPAVHFVCPSIWAWRVLSLMGMLATLRGAPSEAPRKFDRLGYSLLVVCVLMLQLAIDRGQQLDWFDSPEIVLEVSIGLIAGYMFVVHSMSTERPLFAGGLRRDRNLVLGVAMSVLVGWPFMGSMVLLPQFLQEVQGYTVASAGVLMAPRGIGLILSMLVLSRVGSSIDLRAAFAFGCVMNTMGLLAFAWLPADVPADVLTGWLLLQGMGLGLIFVPLNTLTFITLPAEYRTEGAALMVLSRNLGSSLGVAMLVRGISTDAGANFDRLREIAHVPAADDLSSFAWILQMAHREALVIAYSNQYVLLALMPAILLPFVWLMRRNVTTGTLSGPSDRPVPRDEVLH